MEKILSKLFGFLKYILLILAFGLIFFGIIKTYARLEKPLTDAIDVFIPFAFVLVMYIVNMFKKNKYVTDNLFFNFVSVIAFLVIIIIGLRSLFDTNMILWHKYNIDFNPAYFADNLSLINALLYMIGSTNVLLFICGLVDKDKKKKVIIDKEDEVIVKSARKKDTSKKEESKDE